MNEKASLNETLAVGPATLANLVHTYQPDIGALGTRSNLASLTDPATICALLDPSLIPGVPKTIKSPLGPITGVLKSTCKKVLGKIDPGQLTKLLGLPGKLVGGQLGKAINNLIGTVTGGGSGGGGGGGGGAAVYRPRRSEPACPAASSRGARDGVSVCAPAGRRGGGCRHAADRLWLPRSVRHAPARRCRCGQQPADP